MKTMNDAQRDLVLSGLRAIHENNERTLRMMTELKNEYGSLFSALQDARFNDAYDQIAYASGECISDLEFDVQNGS